MASLGAVVFLLALAPQGDNAHFDSLSGGVISSWGLRDNTQIAGVNINANWTYDATEDAAKSTMSGATISYGTADQIILPFARAIDSNTDDYISWQVEVKYGAAWTGDLGALDNHKAIRLDDAAKLYNGGTGDERMHELQMRYSVTDGTAVAVPTMRSYACTNSPSTNEDPLRDADSAPINWQPGGSRYYLSSSGSIPATDHMGTEKPFIILPDTWVRITYVWSKATGLVTITMADASNQAVKVIEYLSSRTTGRTVADTLRLEFNSSQTAPPEMTTDHNIWCRNVLVDNHPITFGTMAA